MKKIIPISIIALFLSAGIAFAAYDMNDLYNAYCATKPASNSIAFMCYLKDSLDNLQAQINNIQLIPGPQGEKGDRGEQGLPGEPGQSGRVLHLYDANNQDLGILVYAGYELKNVKDWFEYTTYIRINDQSVLLNFRNSTSSVRSAYMVTSSTPMVFNCVETFIRDRGFQPQQLYKDVEGGDHRYPSYFVIRPDTGGTRPAWCPSAYTYDNTYLITDITLPFTEPLAWPLEVREN